MPTDQLVRVEPIIDRPIVKIDGERFELWKELSVTIDAASKMASFRLSVGPNLGDMIQRVEMVLPSIETEGDIPHGGAGRLYPGALVEIEFGSKGVVRGLVDSQSIQVSGSSESYDADGRCLLALLRDSGLPSNLKPLTEGKLVTAYKKSSPGTNRVKEAKALLKALATAVISDVKVGYTTPAFTKAEVGELTGEGEQDVGRRELARDILRPRGENAYAYLERVSGALGFRDVWMTADGTLWIGDLKQERALSRAKIEQAGGSSTRLYCFQDPALAAYNNILDVNVTRSIKGVYKTVVCYDTKTGRNQRFRVPIYGSASNPSIAVTKKRYIKCREIGSQDAAKANARQELERGRETELSITATASGYGQRIDGEEHYFVPNQPVQLVHQLAGINWPSASKGMFFLSSATFSCSVGGGPRTTLNIRQEPPDSQAE